MAIDDWLWFKIATGKTNTTDNPLQRDGTSNISAVNDQAIQPGDGESGSHWSSRDSTKIYKSISGFANGYNLFNQENQMEVQIFGKSWISRIQYLC
jgi:hypothetical protein